MIGSDNAYEFQDGDCRNLYLEKGILHQTSCVDRPQKNSRVERRHRNLLEMARALRLQAGLPVRMWGDCLLAAVYITNRAPSKVIEHKCPYKIMFNKKPNYHMLKTFGCLVMSYNPIRDNDKFKERGVPYISIGYPLGKKGFKLLNLHDNSVFVSRDVKFYEGIYLLEIFKSNGEKERDEMHDLFAHELNKKKFEEEGEEVKGTVEEQHDNNEPEEPEGNNSNNERGNDSNNVPTRQPIRQSTRPHKTPR